MTEAPIHEQQAANAFNKQSSVFDSLYSENIIIQYKRNCVRQHVEKYIAANSNILELNAGTGEDAVYFAQQNHQVHATDIAENMQQVLREKRQHYNLVNNITTELCSFTQLNKLQNKGPYDVIFSNFAGLNCTRDLDKVLTSFSALLKQGAIVTLVLLPPFCLWETLLVLKGDFKTAFRRFNSKQGAPAQIEGVKFTCWYYKPSFVINCMKNDYELLSIEGLCSIVPPSYFENFPYKHKKLFKKLVALENSFKKTWPWKFIGDYYIISFGKK